MATLRDIKRRIVGVRNTEKITKAMKMVAAAKLRRAQENVINARPYAQKIAQFLPHLVTYEELNNNPYIVERNGKTTLVVAVTADRGLCGAFNANLIKESESYIQERFFQDIPNAKIYCIGRKGAEHFARTNYNVIGKKTGIFSSLDFHTAVTISNELIKLYMDEVVDKVVIVYNEFKSIIHSKVVVQQFLPIHIEKKQEAEKYYPNFIYEPSQGDIFRYLLPKHLNAQVWRILLESYAAELGARMTAMDNATTNADELIKKLQLTYNKERQAAITTEILEIVSGANALKATE